MKKSIQLNCVCGNEIMTIESIDYSDDYKQYELYFSLHEDIYARKGIIQIIKNRIRSAWLLLRGKEYQFYGIIIEEKTFINFVKECLKESEVINES